MSFFENLKYDLREHFQEPVFSTVNTMPEKDVALLAIMCRMCAPKIKKGKIFKSVYAYYATQQESDIDIAQEIFARNGIHMSVHDSYVFGLDKEPVLRVNYALCDNENKLKYEMRKIEKKYYFLYAPENKSEKIKLYQELEKLRQRQK